MKALGCHRNQDETLTNQQPLYGGPDDGESNGGNTEGQVIVIKSETAITSSEQNIFVMRSNAEFICFRAFFPENI